MSAVPQSQRLSEAEFLEFERTSETKHSYFNGEIYAMVGASREHNLIAGSVYATLYNQTVDRDCEIYQSDMRLKVKATGLYTYPDISVICGKPELTTDALDTIVNPQVIIEVLSPSTERDDRTWKFAHYRQIESMQEYLLISQETPRVEYYRRQEDDTWLLTDIKGLDALVKLVSIDCTLKLADIYRKIDFNDEDANGESQD
jgi:Uma2 family endonuclease